MATILKASAAQLLALDCSETGVSGSCDTRQISHLRLCTGVLQSGMPYVQAIAELWRVLVRTNDPGPQWPLTTIACSVLELHGV